MSNTENRLIADHKDVLATIRKYPNINLINTSGEPVDEYDIEYKVKGYSIGADGKVKVAGQHRIKIKLPFGYPHFPPTIKPLSSVFHPEMDAHVVPIASYWESNKSLPDLVVHIGNMICGQVYTLDSPFNTEAAEYFEEHRDSLPLDSLRTAAEEKKEPEKQPLDLDFLKPLLLGVVGVVILLLVVAGGLYFFEQYKIGASQELLAQAQTSLDRNNFERARRSAESALDKAGSFFLLHASGNSLKDEINSFLTSEKLNEGLAGKVQYGDTFISIERMQKLELADELIAKARGITDSGNVPAAIAAYEEALAYAEENELNEDIDIIQRELSGLKLDILVAASQEAHDSKDWNWAIQQHTKVLDFLEKYGKYLDDADKQAAETKHLLLIDRIAYYSQMAAKAENAGNLKEALQYHNALIELIGKSGATKKSALKTTLLDSMQQAAVLTERINIENRRQWLLNNYKEIFQAHYPGVLAASLRSPQALFVKYDEGNMVFNLSCLDKSSGSVVRLRLFYQYDPKTGQWSPYDGVIEDGG